MKSQRHTHFFNNIVFRALSFLMYKIKRLNLLSKYSIRQKIFISLLFVSSVPMLFVGLIQYIYISTTYPSQLEANISETLKQTDKSFTYELDAIARAKNLVLLDKEFINELDFNHYLSEKELINKINTICDTLGYLDNIVNPLYSSPKKICAYVDWQSIDNMDAYFSSPYLTTVDDLPDGYVDMVQNGSVRSLWYKPHSMPNTIEGSYLSTISPVYNSSQKIIGYIEIGTPISVIEKIMNDVFITPNAFFVMLDNNNDIVYSAYDRDIPDNLSADMAEYSPSDSNKSRREHGYYLLSTSNEISNFKLFASVPSKDIFSLIYNTERTTLIMLICCIILSFILSLPIAYSISSPIVNLSSAMKMSRGNKFRTVLETDRTDEIGALYTSFNDMLREINNLIDSVYKSNLALKEAELDLLQANINPHFLYNTLDTINWLAVVNKQDKIALMARSLANVFRFSLSRGESVIPLKNEIDMLENYINIQKIRLGDKVDIIYDINPEIYSYRSIKIILQPIVENAFLHGIQQSNTKLTITIKAEIINNDIIFLIRDNGSGIDTVKIDEILNAENPQKGYGIRNVNKRIKLYYGKEYGLFYANNSAGGTDVTIKIKALPIGNESN